MSRDRPTTLRILALAMAGALVLGAAAVTAQTEPTTQPSDEPAPTDHPCQRKAANANSTPTARERCTHDPHDLRAKCTRAAQADVNGSVLRARCADHDAESERVLRCHALARSGASWRAINAQCAERFHGHATLGVFVTETSPHGPVPADGATVIAYKITRTDRGFHVQPVERGQTDENGHVAFELAKGYYVVRAGIAGEGGAHKQVKLDDDKRVHLHLSQRHAQPGPFALGIRALERGDDGGAQPAAFAELVLERHNGTRDAPRDGQWMPIERGTTDADGLYATVLPKGVYRVKVVSADGDKEGHKHFLLRHDKWVRVGLVPVDDGALDAAPAGPVGPVPVDTPLDDGAADSDNATDANETDAS